MSVFGDNALKYFEAGWNILPLNGKAPIINGWQEWGKEKQSLFQIEMWLSSYGERNIGLPTGAANGIIALDFDHDSDLLHEQIEKIAGQSPVKKRGAKGYTSFYRYNGETNRKWRKENKPIVELLSTGNQTVIPPSIHPDTNEPYIWLTPDGLHDICASDLPQLPDDFSQQIDKLFGIEKKFISGSVSDIPEIDTIKHALQYIPAIEYTVWVEVGMALHQSYGVQAFDVWDKWSSTAINYDPENMHRKWSSFGKYSGDRLHAGSIMHYALQYGWLPAEAPRLLHDDAVITVSKKNAAQEIRGTHSAARGNKSIVNDSIKPERSQEVNTLPPHLLDAPGLVGELTNWINSTSIRYQPALALASALPAVGMVMAHRFRTPTDLRSNLMTAGVIGSGSGKDHARKCISMLFESVGCGEHLIGDFASDTAMISGLHNRHGIGFTMTDELGDSLASMSGRSASAFESRIMRTTKELFSSANTVFRGKEYANHDGKMAAKVINQPCLCIYGTTTHKQFYDALSGAKVVDGFLPRWLVFEGDGAAKKLKKPGIVLEPPQSLVECFREIWDINPHGGNSLHSVGQIRPCMVNVTEGAEEKFTQLENYAEEMRIKEYASGSGLDAIYARMHEHALKLSLVAHTNQTIDATIAAWSCELVVFVCEHMIANARNKIGDNDYERDLLALKEFIASSTNGRTRREVMRKFSRMEPKQINNALLHLLESDSIYVEESPNMRGKPTQRYYTA